MISDEQIEKGLMAFVFCCEVKVWPAQARWMYDALQELKERRAADKLLDIKAQLRLVRDKCPGMWDLIVTSLYACPSMIDTGLQPNLLDSEDICYGFGNDNCKECWDKALEGDE